MYHRSGDRCWLERARLLAERAVERVTVASFRHDSLYKGEVGVALLVDELAAATPAGLPPNASEGWPPQRR